MVLPAPAKPPSKTGYGTWVVVVSLCALLGAAGFGLWVAMSRGQLPAISVHGWIAMGIGTIFSLAIGCGLMWLSFYSARHGFDERADHGRKRDGGSRAD